MDNITITIPEGTDLNSLEEQPGPAATTHGTAPEAQGPTTTRAILAQLLEALEEVDFTAELGTDFKQKHIIVLVIDKVLKAAKGKAWGLAKQFDFIYLYTGKHWQQLERDEMKVFLSNAAIRLGYSPNESRYYEFSDKLFKQFLAVGHLPTPEPDTSRTLINLQNGTFEVTPKGWKLREHRPEDFLTYLLPFEYIEHAQAPKFSAYLEKVLPDKSAQAVLAEYMGYVFTRHLKLEKCLLLYGDGANGKSVFFEIVRALLGPENVCSYSLGSLSEEHNRAQLAGKLLNYGSEIRNGIDRDIFKALASGEPIQARLKYGNSFLLESYARLCFNANELPKDVEHTEAYFRRFAIVPFSVTIPEAERIPDLAGQIIENELPGVFHWVLQGLERLLQQRKFSYSQAVADTLTQYRKESDSVAQFLEDGENGVYVPSVNEYMKQETMYANYKAFCTESGYRHLSIRRFKERLEKQGFHTEKRNSGKIVYCVFLPSDSQK